VQAKLTSQGWSKETVTALRYLLASEEESRAAKSLQPVRWITEVVQYRQLPTFGYVFKEAQSDATETRVDQVCCGTFRSELVLLVALRFFFPLWAMAFGHSSGLPPYEAADMITEKRKLCYCFSCLL